VSPRKLCTQAAAAISKLMRLYKRSYGLRQIPNIAIYICHSACTIHLLNLPDKNARRDIQHGLKHLEEIAEGWLAARRTLGILSLLARKWNVELPEEASTVLARTDAKFGPYTGEIGSPPAQRRDSQVSMNPSQFAQAALQDPSNLPPATTFFNNPTIPAVAVPAHSSGAPVQESSHNFQQPPLNAADLRAQQYPSATTSPGQGPANAYTNRQPTSTTSAASPSDMFGGIEQLLRDSNDWVYKDQAQWATGFENWDVDPSTWTNGGFGSGDGTAMMNGMNGMNGMPGMNQMPTNHSGAAGPNLASMQSTSPAYSATSAGAAAPPYMGTDGSWLNGMNPGNLSAYDENAWYS
ncbi:Nitrogen assimilation transcription factor, partial [Hortaea werneckii]